MASEHAKPLRAEEIPWPVCIHRWDAPETCPSCLAIYKQRRIEQLEAALAAREAEIERLEMNVQSAIDEMEEVADERDKRIAELEAKSGEELGRA